jgi:hypothetical protein
MTEAFLYYVWQFQYFSKSGLQTTDGAPVSIYNPGQRNLHAGPDFFHARVRIGDMEWVGNIEMHIHASGWTSHKHDKDTAYENVILHVVWKEDEKIVRKDQSVLPTLELKDRVSDKLLLQYRRLVNTPMKIPCASFISAITDLTRHSMFDKALMQRLETKAGQVRGRLERNHFDWEETAYQMLCANFGFKVNAEPFEQLAQSLPYKYLLKHADQPLQVEAMLFGHAGFLADSFNDTYFMLLKREHALLRAKYTLADRELNKAQWRFLRLRPANFPTLRIAQLAALLCTQKNIFSTLVETATFRALQAVFAVTQSAYWQHHYRFDKAVEEPVPPLGAMSVSNIMINTVVPLLVAYGKTKDEQRYVDRAIDILQHLAAEENTIIRSWQALGVKCTSAADSQALIELYNGFCLRRRCLDCNIGFSILQPSVT